MKSIFMGILIVFIPQLGFSYAETPLNVLVTVGDTQNTEKNTEKSEDGQFQREMCRKAYDIGNTVVTEQPVHITCQKLSSGSGLGRIQNQVYGTFDYQILIKKEKDGIVLDISKLQRKFVSDFKTVAVKLAPKGSETEQKQDVVEAALNRNLYNFFVYAGNEEFFKLGLLVNGIEESQSISFDPEKAVFLDKADGKEISLNQAYHKYESESPRKINYLRAATELGVLFSAGMAIYYKNLVYNQHDFDYGFKEGLKKKFITGEAIRFDDNDKGANVGHEFAGVLYYQTARANGANHLESFLVAFAGSALWETLEYHEVFSINDQIMTSVAGYAIGEALYQTSCSLLQKDSLTAKTLGYAFSPMLGINHGIDKYKTGNRFASQPDCAKPRWSDISFHLGLEKNQKSYKPTGKESSNYFVSFNSEVITLPGYGKVGKEKGLIFDSALNRLNLEAKVQGGGIVDFRFLAQVVAGAYYNRNVKKDEQGALSGYEVILGLGTASTWSDSDSKTKDTVGSNEAKNDYYGTINILGPVAHATVYHKGIRINAEFSFYGDFTLVKSYALESFLDSGIDPSTLPSELAKRGNYYGLGSTLLSAISAEYGKWKVAYQGQNSSSSSINSRHRFQSETTRSDDYEDQYRTDRFTLSYQLTERLRIELFREYIHRQGSVNSGFVRTGKEKRTGANLVYLF